MKEKQLNLPRIAASSYLNSAPLIWSFIHGSRQRDVELLTDTAPATCADMLARGDVVAALVPTIEYQRIAGLSVVPEVCIGSRSEVRSVVLILRRGLDDLRGVRRVALDSSSRTSAALVQIIFREFIGFEPEWSSIEPNIGAMLEDNDAALVIGDPSMTFARENLVVVDLAQFWRQHTGLGFVFAMWMLRDGDAKAVSRIDFAGARDEGLGHVEEIVSLYEDAVGLSPAELKSYLLENISYDLDEELTKGLDLFYKLAHKHGLIEEISPLRFRSA